MSGVVLRCPQCGTTRSGPGECEACHEAEVRYYCTNHMPGLWLDAEVCSSCGAKFGVPAPPPRPARRPTASPPPRPRPSRPAPRPVEDPWTPPPDLRRPPPELDDATAERRDPRGLPITWHDILREAAERARRARAESPPMERVAVGAVVGGFVRRLIWLVLMMILFFFLASYLVGGLFLQGLDGGF